MPIRLPRVTTPRRARGELLPGPVLASREQARGRLDGRVPGAEPGAREDPGGVPDVQRFPPGGRHAEPHDLP